MSNTKRALDDAAEALDVPVDALTDWLTTGTYRSMPPHGAVASNVTATVYRAADDLNVHPLDLDAWLRHRRRPRTSAVGAGAVEWMNQPVVTYASYSVTPAELVSEDDYRGVAADFIARWADDQMAPHDVLAALNLAAHGMPVTTPSRRALAKIRAAIDEARRRDDGDEAALRESLAAILDEVGA